MPSVRIALAEYLDTIRKYAYEIANVKSGIFPRDDPQFFLQQPNVWFQKEADWVEVLNKGIEIIRQYVDVVNRWITHIRGFVNNLHLTGTEYRQIVENQGGMIEFLQTKTYDEEYLYWVLEDTSEEVERLAIASRELLEQAPTLVTLTNQIQGTFMKNVKQITQTWTTQNLSELYSKLITLLEASTASKNLPETIKHLGTYGDIIITVLASTPLFADDNSADLTSLELFQEVTTNIQKLVQSTQDFREFVRLRSIAYQRFLEHIKALIQAFLLSPKDVNPWIIQFVKDASKPALKLLPKEIPTDTLPLAFLQAEDAQNDWVAISTKLKPLRQSAFKLNEVLQSPAIAQFLTADQQRREITNKWLPKMLVKYQSLREAV
ncbi:MAG: hypothetical protein Q6364_06490 [Candidatus Hermodarchaeota archaeon]|nr:hypothetical protein [Candidatus Hermodarchaeota archaeon]